MTEVSIDINIPRLSFTSKTISRKIIRDPTKIDDIKWSQGRLIIDDMLSGGQSSSVLVNFCVKKNKVFIQAIEKNNKHEFEIIFGFGCDQFIKDRVIKLDSKFVSIDH